jgi:hypothetical protein
MEALSSVEKASSARRPRSCATTMSLGRLVSIIRQRLLSDLDSDVGSRWRRRLGAIDNIRKNDD